MPLPEFPRGENPFDMPHVRIVMKRDPSLPYMIRRILATPGAIVPIEETIIDDYEIEHSAEMNAIVITVHPNYTELIAFDVPEIFQGLTIYDDEDGDISSDDLDFWSE